MFFPEFLFKISQRDQQVTWLDPFFSADGLNLANVSVSAASIVPEGRALVLTHAFGRFTPGAGQNFTVLQLFYDKGSGILPAMPLKESRTAGAANAIGLLDWQGQVVLTPGNRIVVTGTFNAGAAVNAVEVRAAGMLLPIGNIQRV